MFFFENSDGKASEFGCLVFPEFGHDYEYIVLPIILSMVLIDILTEDCQHSICNYVDGEVATTRLPDGRTLATHR